MGSPQSVYTLELSKLGQGYPLWDPEPPSRFEVEIGDIGFIADGSFYHLFRATEGPTHPINAKYGVPDGFTKLDVANLAATRVENAIPAGPLVSPGVKRTSVGGQTEGTGADFTFECTEDNGAILVLGAPATRQRLRHDRRIKTYIRTHLRNWHTFAVEKLDLDLSEDDVVFVSGWVKTTEWSLAAFTGDAKNTRITFNPDGDGVAGGRWQINETRDANWALEYHSGPPSDGVRKNEERRINKAAVSNESNDGYRRGKQDQCVFLHYYKLKKRFLCIKSMKSMAEPRSLSPGSDDHDAENSPAPRKRHEPEDYILDRDLQHSDSETMLAGDGDFFDIYEASHAKEFGSPNPDGISGFSESVRPQIKVTSGIGMSSLGETNRYQTGVEYSTAAEQADVAHIDGAGEGICAGDVFSISTHDANSSLELQRRRQTSPSDGTVAITEQYPLLFSEKTVAVLGKIP